MKHKDIPARDRLIFAMDVPDCDQARSLADELGDAVTFYKIGLELMMSGGYFELLDWMLERDKKVFCDLKFFDIPATVGSAVRALKDRGASFVTVHGNQSIMEAAAENKGDTLKVLAVTVLTSLDRGDLDQGAHRVLDPGLGEVEHAPDHLLLHRLNIAVALIGQGSRSRDGRSRGPSRGYLHRRRTCRPGSA